MATLRKPTRSPFWHACITLQDGTRTNRSTGTTNRREAERIANKLEDAISEAKRGRFIDARARKTIADIYAIGRGEPLGSSTAANFFTGWLKRKELEAGENTHTRYASVIKQFIAFLGAKAARDISSISAADISNFRDALAGRLSIGSVNVSLKILRSAFGQAQRDTLVEVNEAGRVSTLKRREDLFERRPFSLPELKRIIEAADDEWRGMILFGLYTGQRLGDIAGLTWQNVDLARQELRLVTAKTKRRQILPLAAPLLHYVESLPSSDAPDAPIFPRAHAMLERLGRVGSLSNQFYEVLTAAGLAGKKTHHRPKAGETKGRSARRDLNVLSFHSLRHTATTLLKAAGVSDAVAMEFIGHDTKSISQNYTHIETATLRAAAAKLPDVTR
jgi:integrase